jgi:integrase
MPTKGRTKTRYPGVYFIVGRATSNQTKAERIYYIRYRKGGKMFEEKAGRQYADDMTAARASQIRAKRIHGDELSNQGRREAQRVKREAENNTWTVDRLWNEYVNANPDLKGYRTYKSAYNLHVGPAFGKMEPKNILPLDIKRVSNRLLKTKSPQTVQHVLELLRRLINFGVNSRLCRGIDFRIEMPRVDNIKTEDLTNPQIRRLLEAIEADPHPQAGVIMKVALYTAMRKSELLRLQWNHINFDKKFISIVDPKGGKDQTIPLNDATEQLLSDYRHRNPSRSRYVFPGRSGGQRTTIARQVRRIRERAGLPKDFRPLHGLRHVHASMLASSGKVDMFALQRLLTHKDFTMTQRYAHLRDYAMKRASDLAGDIIGSAAKGSDVQDGKIVHLSDKKV